MRHANKVDKTRSLSPGHDIVAIETQRPSMKPKNENHLAQRALLIKEGLNPPAKYVHIGGKYQSKTAVVQQGSPENISVSELMEKRLSHYSNTFDRSTKAPT